MRYFQEWMRAMNRHISTKIMVDSGDLPDLNFRDFYDDELTPREAAELALETWAEQGDVPYDLI